jgi:hypothetical protein
MIKTYTENVVSSDTISIAIVGMTMFNSEQITKYAQAYIYDKNGMQRSQLMNMQIEPNETIFLSTKIFLSGGDELRVNGVEFTMSGDESAI